eukprot:snap_masked-scaffold_4-processed-gene-17.45-mRNA-1 protein AED:0.03 eAED:0.03 QI:0/-1/0/1/-1/1/1/0/469
MVSNKTKIIAIKARQIFDSRGNPTVEVDLSTVLGTFRAAVPSGASTGVHEAHELRDGKEFGYMGKGVSKAVDNINNDIAPKLIASNLPCTDQAGIDNLMIELDGSENKKNLGANAILAVSLAVCRAAAKSEDLPLWKYIAKLAGNTHPVLPVPAFNIINGGSHAGNKLGMQEFMILPTKAKSFTEAMKIGSEVYHTLKGVIKNKYGLDATAVGDEGGFAPGGVGSGEEAVSLILDAIKEAGYEGQVDIGMDVAASEMVGDKPGEVWSTDEAEKKASMEKKMYDLDFKGPGNVISGTELMGVYEAMIDQAEKAGGRVISIEDPFDEDDWVAWAEMTEKFGDRVQIVGDDLLVTNPKRIGTGIERKACNALLLKVNQIGSVTESVEAVKKAKQAGWGVMTSHRSGETEDTFIADLAVGLSTGQIKAGAPCRTERLAKYNQLLRIEEAMNEEGGAEYAGEKFRDVEWLGAFV